MNNKFLIKILNFIGPKVEKSVAALGKVGRLAGLKIVSFARWPVLHYTRWGLYPQALFVIIALIWFEYRPEWAVQGPGVAMAFLAVAAIIMAVRGPDSTRFEGVVWVIASFLLFAGEMRSIRVERKQHETEQAELRRREEATRGQQTRSFAELIAQGKVLFKSLAEEKELTARNLEHLTGGNEYCWVTPSHPLPVVVGGDPAHQSDDYWQLGLRNSGNVVLPSCDITFMPFPTEKELKAGVQMVPPFIFYHFDKVPVMGRRYYRTTSYYIKGDRIYSGKIQTPTRTFVIVIKFEPDSKDRTGYSPKCLVTAPSGKILETDCYPQK